MFDIGKKKMSFQGNCMNYAWTVPLFAHESWGKDENAFRVTRQNEKKNHLLSLEPRSIKFGGTFAFSPFLSYWRHLHKTYWRHIILISDILATIRWYKVRGNLGWGFGWNHGLNKNWFFLLGRRGVRILLHSLRAEKGKKVPRRIIMPIRPLVVVLWHPLCCLGISFPDLAI